MTAHGFYMSHTRSDIQVYITMDHRRDPLRQIWTLYPWYNGEDSSHFLHFEWQLHWGVAFYTKTFQKSADYATTNKGCLSSSSDKACQQSWSYFWTKTYFLITIIYRGASFALKKSVKSGNTLTNQPLEVAWRIYYIQALLLSSAIYCTKLSQNYSIQNLAAHYLTG